ncbi:MAG: site-2 protease family protein [Pseudomonadota bacterium]
MSDFSEIGYYISVLLVPILSAIILHEAAHGWMANRLGDDTAKRLGRVTLNPIPHIDPLGTILIPGMLLLAGSPFVIGFAKPVPVAFHRLNNPKRDMIWVALAGPGSNILLGTVAAFFLHFVIGAQSDVGEWIATNLQFALLFNAILAVFNMLPIPPLDGGRVLTGLLPKPYDYQFAQLERYGLFILLGIIFLVPFLAQSMGVDFNPIASILMPATNVIREFLFNITGLIA